jgi:hypothetical protein
MVLAQRKFPLLKSLKARIGVLMSKYDCVPLLFNYITKIYKTPKHPQRLEQILYFILRFLFWLVGNAPHSFQYCGAWSFWCLQ